MHEANGARHSRKIASSLGLGQSTAYRLLATLHHQDYLARQPGEHRYILGRSVDDLGRALQVQLVATDPVRAVLRELHDAVHAPAYLTVFRGDDIAVAHIEDSPEHPRIAQLHVGFSEASHTTGLQNSSMSGGKRTPGMPCNAVR